jgi:hypothetical protein
MRSSKSKSPQRESMRSAGDRVRRRILARLRDAAGTPTKSGAPVQLSVFHKWMAAYYFYLRKQTYRSPNSEKAVPTKEASAAQKVSEVWGTSVSAVRQCAAKYEKDADWLVENVPGAFVPNFVAGIDESPLAQLVRTFRILSDPETEGNQVENPRRSRRKTRKP